MCSTEGFNTFNSVSRLFCKLNRSDVGWYQVRNALAARNASGDTAPVNFDHFEQAYQALSEKLRPQEFSLGFLR